MADLRIELRALRNGDRHSSKGGASAAGSRDDAGVCPHCGHTLDSP